MSAGADRPSLDDIRAFIVEMQPIMGLRDWRFIVRAAGDDEVDNGWFEVRHSYSLLEAHILVTSGVLNGRSPRDWHVGVIHELAHLYEGPFPSQIGALIRAIVADEALQRTLLGFVADLEESFVDRAAETIWNLFRHRRADGYTGAR